MATIVIKPVIIAEQYADISQLMRELHDHEYLLHNKTAKWDDIEVSYMRHVIAMQEDCDGLCLMAYADDAAVGFMFGYLDEDGDSRIEVYTGKELYVSDGYVTDAYRRQGIYKQLNEQMEQHYIKQGVKHITRFARVNNIRMSQFMEQQGYEVTRFLYEKWL